MENISWISASKIVITAFASVLSAGTIILMLSGWLGKVWASRILEKEKKEHKKEITEYKIQLEEIRTNALRYSGVQFELYKSFWDALCDLEDTASATWKDNSQENLRNFIINLKKADKELKKAYLFLNEEHYIELQKLFKKFESYQLGKGKLYALYHDEELIKKISKTDIKRLINKIILENFKEKSEYEILIKKIGKGFKETIKGNKII